MRFQVQGPEDGGDDHQDRLAQRGGVRAHAEGVGDVDGEQGAANPRRRQDHVRQDRGQGGNHQVNSSLIVVQGSGERI